MTGLTKEQLRAMFAKKGITLRAKGTVPVKTKLARSIEFQNFDVEKVQGANDLVVVRQKGSERGVLTTRKEMAEIMRKVKERRTIPKDSNVIKLGEI
jgi:hypothetical protein